MSCILRAGGSHGTPEAKSLGLQRAPEFRATLADLQRSPPRRTQAKGKRRARSIKKSM
jgi:hypothetical protein